MVEASIVLSIFFVLVLGMIEMSQMGLTSQLLASAANAGCRVAVINGHTQSDVNNAVANILASGGISSSSYTLTTMTLPPSPLSPSTDITTAHLGDGITVTISVPFSKISWFGTPIYLGSANIVSSATMSSQRP